MRSSVLFFLLFTAGMVTAQSAPPASPTAASPLNPASADVQKAKDIVQKSILALGGQAFLNFRTMRQEGRGYGFYQNTPKGVGIPLVRSYQFPDKERIDYFRDGEWYLLYVGDKGYETTFRGTREQEKDILAEYLRRRHYSLDHILREWANDPKTAWFYDGESVKETKMVYKISLLNAQNQGASLYIDQSTYLPVAKSFSYRDPETRDITEETELYDGYRVEDGIMAPHVITRQMNGEIRAQFFFKKVTFNLPEAQGYFTPPPLNWDTTKK